MQTVAQARGKVEAARSDSELQPALTELASALFEADAEEAVVVAGRSVALAQKLGDQLALAWALNNRGWALSSLGRLDEALTNQLAALDLFEARRDERGIAHSLLAIGDIHGEAGDTASALEFLDRAAGPMARAGDELGQGIMLNLTGIALSREARHREAAELFTQAEKLFESLADPVRVITTKINRGFEMLDMAAGEAEGAAFVAEVENIANEVIGQGVLGGEDGRNTVAYGHSLLSRVHAFRGDFDAALADAGYAEEVARAGGFDLLGIEIALDRLEWMIRLGDLDRAVELMARTVVIASSPDNRRSLAKATQLQADLLEALGDHAGALASFRQFHVLDRDLHNDEAERRSRVTMARLEVESARRETQLARVSGHPTRSPR